ncbi:MAG: GNAT family N-acetyltransferase, partial [Thermoanaerobaculia bacterium]
VTERLWRAGIGSQLLAAAERWAVEHGATELETDIWEFGEGPLGFYEREGYATRRRTLARRLKPEAPFA